MTVVITLCMALALVNAATFLIFGIDKRRAIQKKRRVRERTLLLFCACFAALGGLMGMRTFHHKTLKSKFRIGVPAMLVVQLAALAYLSFAMLS